MANLTVPELAERWRCSRAKVYRLMKSGFVPYATIGFRRLVPEDVVNSIEKATMKST